jgi:hypothetical protein
VVNRETVIAGAFTLVCVMSSEPILRCFNLDTRENQVMYLNNISTSDPGAKGAAALEVTALSYHSEDHILAVGLSDGHIRCFHHLQERRCDALRLSYGLQAPCRIACCPELTYCRTFSYSIFFPYAFDTWHMSRELEEGEEASPLTWNNMDILFYMPEGGSGSNLHTHESMKQYFRVCSFDEVNVFGRCFQPKKVFSRTRLGVEKSVRRHCAKPRDICVLKRKVLFCLSRF